MALVAVDGKYVSQVEVLMSRGKPRSNLMYQGRVVRMQFRNRKEGKMLNPAYSLDEQAEELLERAEAAFQIATACDDLSQCRRAIIERWTADFWKFRQRRLIAEAKCHTDLTTEDDGASRR